MMIHPEFRNSFEAIRGPRSYTAQQFIEAFWMRTKASPTGCVLWIGALGGRSNAPYGVVNIAGRAMTAHRAALWMATGHAPPPDLQADHLCRVTLCVNPDHLELVTGAENNRRSNSPTGMNARKTYCKHGHEFTPSNTRTTASGKRDCRACHRDRIRRNYWRNKEISA